MIKTSRQTDLHVWQPVWMCLRSMTYSSLPSRCSLPFLNNRSEGTRVSIKHCFSFPRNEHNNAHRMIPSRRCILALILLSTSVISPPPPAVSSKTAPLETMEAPELEDPPPPIETTTESSLRLSLRSAAPEEVGGPPSMDTEVFRARSLAICTVFWIRSNLVAGS